MHKKLLTLAIGALLLTNAYALSNEEFAQQVQTYEKQIKADKKFDAEVKALCGSLGAQRREEEPKCVALKKVGLAKVYGSIKTTRLKE